MIREIFGAKEQGANKNEIESNTSDEIKNKKYETGKFKGRAYLGPLTIDTSNEDNRKVYHRCNLITWRGVCRGKNRPCA